MKCKICKSKKQITAYYDGIQMCSGCARILSGLTDRAYRICAEYFRIKFDKHEELYK